MSVKDNQVMDCSEDNDVCTDGPTEHKKLLARIEYLPQHAEPDKYELLLGNWHRVCKLIMLKDRKH